MVDLAKFSAALPKLWPHGDSVAGTIASFPDVMEKYKITSDLVICHAMAEYSEESGAGTEMMENMNYSAARLLQVFPSHFTYAQAIAMQHQPRLIADQAYGSRMGNHPGTDDGWNFRGPGFSQLRAGQAISRWQNGSGSISSIIPNFYATWRTRWTAHSAISSSADACLTVVAGACAKIIFNDANSIAGQRCPSTACKLGLACGLPSVIQRPSGSLQKRDV